MAAGGMNDGILSHRYCVAHALADRVCKFCHHGLRILPAARLHSGLRHGTGAICARLGDRCSFHVLFPRPGGRSRRLRSWAVHHRCQCCVADRSGRPRHNRMGLRPANAAAGFGDLAAAAIGGDALVWHPDAFRQFADLPEHIDRHSAARIPVAADP